jgi:hypothetical protein
MPSSDRPSAKELNQILDRLAPEIARLLHGRGFSVSEAVKLVSDALVALAHRWNRVGDRDRWLLKTLDEQTRDRPGAPPGAPPKEPADE